MVKKAKKLPVSKIIGENYDDGTPVPPDEKKAAYMKKAREMAVDSMPPSGETLISKEPVIPPVTVTEIETVPAHGVKAFNEALHEAAELLADVEEPLPEPWELDDVLLVCGQCGYAVRVPPAEKVPETCRCGLVYDHEHLLEVTEIVIDEPTMLVVRKMARKW